MTGKNRRVPTHGSVSTELFQFECAALILMNLDENIPPRHFSRFLRLGAFVVKLLMQTTSNILMTTCEVCDLEWIITKDAPIIRIGQRSFAFALPGLLFGLQLPPFCSADTVDNLGSVFLRFADYTDLYCERRQGYPYPDNDPNFWVNHRPQVQEISRSKLARYGHIFYRPPYPGVSVDPVLSYLLRAIRMFTATKAMIDALLKGTLKSFHISIIDTRQLRYQERTIHVPGSEDTYASVEVISDIVQTLEIPGMAATRENPSQEAPAQPQDEPVASVSPRQLPFKHWKLNEVGTSMLLCQIERINRPEI